MSAERERVLSLRAEGLGVRRIARATGVSKTTVKRWIDPSYDERLRRLSLEAKQRRTGICVDCGATTRYAGHGQDVSLRCPPCANKANRQVDHDEIVRLRERGLTQTAIAAMVGCSQWNVSRVLMANGLGVGKGSRAGIRP